MSLDDNIAALRVAQAQTATEVSEEEVSEPDIYGAVLWQNDEEKEDHLALVCESVGRYRERGIAVANIKAGSKMPCYPGWNLQSQEVGGFARCDNVAILPGALSNDLVCVDLDDAKALALADRFLPPTGMVEGRPAKPRSHRYYRVTGIPPDLRARPTSRSGKMLGGPRTEIYRHAATRKVVVELLGTGRAAVAPPSRHWSGETREWDKFDEPATVDCRQLYQAVAELAKACGWQKKDEAAWQKRPNVSSGLPTTAAGWKARDNEMARRLGLQPGSTTLIPALAGGKPSSRGDVSSSWPTSNGQGAETNDSYAAGELTRQYYPGLPPMEERIRRARSYIDKIDGAIMGEGGSTLTFRVACILIRDFALDLDSARELLEEYNERCEPPWSDAELEHKLSDAEKCEGMRGSKLADERRPPAMEQCSSSALPANQTCLADALREPDVLESVTDPYRLARAFLADDATTENKPRWRYWREEYWRWNGNCYALVADKDVGARIHAAIRNELERALPLQDQAQQRKYQQALTAWQQNQTGKQPTPPGPLTVTPVTNKIVSDATHAFQALTAVPFDREQPIWLMGDCKDLPRQVLALNNGLIDLDKYLDSGAARLMPHTPHWFSSVRLPYDWLPQGGCARWLDALDLMFAGDAERIALLQEWFGYCVTPWTDHQKFLMLVGEGNNGKSVLCAALTAMLGSVNVSHVPLERFGLNFGLTSTLGKLANVAAEIGELDKSAEGLLKSYTSGERMDFDRKFKQPVQAMPTARLVFATNNLPRFTDRSGGMWRRLLLVPCDVKIPADRRVLSMDKAPWWEDSGELSGMLIWALEGLRRLRQKGEFTDPAICKDALSQYRLDNNPTRMFLEEHCEVNTRGKIPTESLYKAYREWCEENGHHSLAVGQFGKEVFRVFPTVERKQITHGSQRPHNYVGIGFAGMSGSLRDVIRLGLT